jgi:hypothetical protein
MQKMLGKCYRFFSFLNTYSLIMFVSWALSTLSIMITFYLPWQATGQASEDGSTGTFATYHNSTYGIKINYPADWMMVGTNGFVGQSNVNKTNPVNVAMFTSLDESVVFGLTVANRIQENKALSQEVNESIISMKKDLPDLKIIESNPINIGVIPAHKIVGFGTASIGPGLLKNLGIENLTQGFDTGNLLSSPVKIMAIVMFKDNKEYGIEFSGPEDQYSRYLSTAQKMIDSFEIESPATGGNNSIPLTASNATKPNGVMKGLSVSIAVSKDPISPREQEAITIAVSDASSKQNVVGAKIKGEVISQSQSTVNEFEDVTDAKGQLPYSWTISGSSQRGTFIVLVHANAIGYEPKAATVTFEVK